MGRCAHFAASVSLCAGLIGFAQGAELPKKAPAAPVPSASKPVAAKAEPARIELDGVVLLSTASAGVTHRTAEHLRDRLKLYRKFLPPRIELKRLVDGAISIRLFGTAAEYQAAVRSYGLRIDNPACYLPEPRVILLGFDGAVYDAVLTAGELNAAKINQQRNEAARLHAQAVKEEAERFQRDNVAPEVRHALSQQRIKAFQRADQAASKQRTAADDKNEKQLDLATERLLALADHELFHAYVRNEVYPQADAGLPAWLDEGLAQLVEHGPRRGDTLFDARSATLREALRNELKKSGESPTAAALLASDDQHYLLADRRETDEVRRRYVFAWALAHLLVETKRLTPRDGLDRYVAERRDDPTAAFARLTKKSPPEFEAEWREFLAKASR